MAKMMDGAHLLKGVPAQEAAFGVWTWNRPCERGLVGWGGGRTAPDVACMRRANGMRLIRRVRLGLLQSWWGKTHGSIPAASDTALIDAMIMKTSSGPFSVNRA